MSEVMLLWALGQSKRLRFLVPVYEAVLRARLLGGAPVRVKGLRWDGEVFDLEGVLRRQSEAPETDAGAAGRVSSDLFGSG